MCNMLHESESHRQERPPIHSSSSSSGSLGKKRKFDIAFLTGESEGEPLTIQTNLSSSAINESNNNNYKHPLSPPLTTTTDSDYNSLRGGEFLDDSSNSSMIDILTNGSSSSDNEEELSKYPFDHSFQFQIKQQNLSPNINNHVRKLKSRKANGNVGKKNVKEETRLLQSKGRFEINHESIKIKDNPKFSSTIQQPFMLPSPFTLFPHAISHKFQSMSPFTPTSSMGGHFRNQNIQQSQGFRDKSSTTNQADNYQNVFPKLRSSSFPSISAAGDQHYFPMQYSNHHLIMQSPTFSPQESQSQANSMQQQEVLTTGAGGGRGPHSATLLPPSLTALTLPAQNVCAKCGIGFRMTSDLVYHMRSHHKRESFDPLKRQREEKLKCSVCHESFRERHHLTRHMTAHQDRQEEANANANTAAKNIPSTSTSESRAPHSSFMGNFSISAINSK